MMRKVKLIFLVVLLGALCGSLWCPSDGSAQTPPNAPAATAILRGKVTTGPTVPVERAGGPPAIAPVAGASVNVTDPNGYQSHRRSPARTAPTEYRSRPAITS